MFEFTTTEMLTICAILVGWAALFVARGFQQAIAGSALIGIFSLGFVIYDMMFSSAGPILDGGMVIIALAILPTTFLIYLGGRVLRALPFNVAARDVKGKALA